MISANDFLFRLIILLRERFSCARDFPNDPPSDGMCGTPLISAYTPFYCILYTVYVCVGPPVVNWGNHLQCSGMLTHLTPSALPRNLNSADLFRWLSYLLPLYSCIYTSVPTYSYDCRISLSNLRNAIMYSPLCNAQLPKAHSGHYQSLQTLKTTDSTIIANISELSIPKGTFNFLETCNL